MLEGLAQLLHDRTVIVWDPEGPTGNCRLHEMPDAPDTAIMVEYVGGDASDVVLPYDSTLVRIVARGPVNDLDTAHSLARQVYSELHGFHTKALPDGTWIVNCEAMGPPSYRGEDDKYRHLFAVSLRIEAESITAHREGL